MDRGKLLCFTVAVGSALVGCGGSGGTGGGGTPVNLDQVAFVRTVDGQTDIFLRGLAGESSTNLTNHPSLQYQPSFSPDGKKIAFESNRDASWQIWSMNTTGTAQTVLTSEGTNYAPAWSPDGTKITFISNRSGNWEVYVMNADGTNQTRLTNTAADEDFPSFSPDGQKIIYISGNDIWTMNANGTGQALLREITPGFAASPGYNPAGTKVVYMRFNGSDREIFTMNADGTNVSLLATNGRAPVWGRNGRIVYHSTNGTNQILVTDTNGANPQTLATYPTEVADPAMP